MNPKLLKNIFVPNKKILMLFKIYGCSVNSLKQRECWNCHNKLDFWDYLSQFEEDEILRAIDLWQDNRIEFYCCECFELKMSDSKQTDKFICPGKMFTLHLNKVKV